MKICKMGVWDDSIPGINFDSEGVSNYAKIQLALMEAYPRGKHGEKDWAEIVKNVKANSPKKSKYDCVVGVSGGVDSSYLLYILKVKYISMYQAIITGATGFIGAVFVDVLIKRNIKVLALGRKNYDEINSYKKRLLKGATYLQIDMN